MKATMMFVTAAALILSTATVAPAQTSAAQYCSEASSYLTVNMTAAEKAYATCLSSENSGVVESALAHVVVMKFVAPATAHARIMRRLEALATTGSTPVIRYKAYIAAQVYENPGLFIRESRAEYASSDALFAALASRLQSTYLSENVKQ